MKQTKRNIFFKVIKMVLFILTIIITLSIISSKNGDVEASSASNRTFMLYNGKNKNLEPEASNGIDWRGHYVYWGEGTSNMKWQILDTASTEYATEYTKRPSLLILSGGLGQTQFSKASNPKGKDYSESELHWYLEYKYRPIGENNTVGYGVGLYALNGSSNIGAAYTDTYNDATFSGMGWFAPTGKMMGNTSYGFKPVKTPDKARSTNIKSDYWLSSYASSPTNDNVGIVKGDTGSLDGKSPNSTIETRAAANIDTGTIAFISDANVDKPNTLSEVKESNSKDWELTISCPSSFGGLFLDATGYARIDETKIRFEYLNLNSDIAAKDYIMSAIITDKDENIIQYGKVAEGIDFERKAYGYVTIPEDFNKNGYKLYVFEETRRAGNLIDFTGSLESILVEDLESINVKTPPANNTYKNNQAFNTAGMVIEAKYTNGKTETITDYTVSPEVLHAGDTEVTISYTKFGITKTVTVPITVIDTVTNKNIMFYNWDKTNLEPQASTGMDWRGHYLYWGKDPTKKWQILNIASREYTGIDKPGLLILSGSLGKIGYYKKETYVNEKCDLLLGSGSLEWNATLGSSNAAGAEAYYKVEYNRELQDNTFNNLKWFIPPGRLMANRFNGFETATKVDKARYTNVDDNDFYWLSSSAGGYWGVVYLQKEREGVIAGTIKSDAPHNTRVASNIDTQSILFISDAKKGKSKILSNVTDSENTEWKLTLKDTSQELIVSDAERISTTKVNFKYTKKGSGNAISAIITDKEGNLVQYGKVSDAEDFGTATITLPDKFDENEYKLKVFSEILNENTLTDYAGDFKEIQMKLSSPTPIVTESSKTASSITIEPLSNTDKYGEAQYSIDGTHWLASNDFNGLKADTEYTIYAKYVGMGNHIESDIGSKKIKTNPAVYTISIPKEAIAGSEAVDVKVNSEEAFELGYEGKIQISITNDTRPYVILQRENSDETIQSMMEVKNVDLTSGIIANFTKNDDLIPLKFKEPTNTNILAGIYKGTVIFKIEYKQ